MKKLSIATMLFVCALFFSEATYAQFGVRAGVNLANLSPSDFDSRVGFHAGVYYGLSITEQITVEPGVFYSAKKYRDSPADVEENLNYVDIPVLARYKITDELNVFVGPQASLLASRKRVETNQTIDSTDGIRKYDLAGVFGVGYELPANLNVQVSYDLGLISLNYYDVNVKTRTFKVSLARRF